MRGMDPVKLRSTDGRTVRIEFGQYTFSPAEAREFAAELLESVALAHDLPSQHERHTDLLARCPLCVHEAGHQTDRLTYDDDTPFEALSDEDKRWAAEGWLEGSQY